MAWSKLKLCISNQTIKQVTMQQSIATGRDFWSNVFNQFTTHIKDCLNDLGGDFYRRELYTCLGSSILLSYSWHHQWNVPIRLWPMAAMFSLGNIYNNTCYRWAGRPAGCRGPCMDDMIEEHLNISQLWFNFTATYSLYALQKQKCDDMLGPQNLPSSYAEVKFIMLGRLL